MNGKVLMKFLEENSFHLERVKGSHHIMDNGSVSTMYYFAKLTQHNDNGNSYFVVSFPDVKGAISDGLTIEEAIENGKEALEGCLEVMLEKTD